jgi:hypothetical protein
METSTQQKLDNGDMETSTQLQGRSPDAEKWKQDMGHTNGINGELQDINQ